MGPAPKSFALSLQCSLPNKETGPGSPPNHFGLKHMAHNCVIFFKKWIIIKATTKKGERRRKGCLTHLYPALSLPVINCPHSKQVFLKKLSFPKMKERKKNTFHSLQYKNTRR